MQKSRRNHIIGNTVILQLSSDTIKYTFSKTIPGLCGFFSIFIFMRMIGADQYGHYALAITFVNMVSAFCGGWIRQALLRYYTNYTTQISILRKALFFAIILAIVIGIILMFLVALNLSDKKGYSFACFVPIGILFCVMMVYNIRLTLFQVQLNPHQVMIFEFVRSLLGLALPLALIYIFAKSYLSIIIGLVMAYVLPLLWPRAWFVEVPLSGDSVRNDIATSTKAILTKFWDYGWPLSFWFSCVIMLQVTDRYLIQYFYNFADTGVYSSLYDIVIRSYSLLLFPITLAAHPRIMNLWNIEKRHEALSTLKWALLAELILFIPIFVVYSTCSRLILHMLLPEADSSYVTLLPPLAVGGFLWQLALLIHKPLEILAKTKSMLIAVILALSVNIAGNYMFLPIYGVIVAAYTTIAASLVYFVICFGLSLRLQLQNQ